MDADFLSTVATIAGFIGVGIGTIALFASMYPPQSTPGMDWTRSTRTTRKNRVYRNGDKIGVNPDTHADHTIPADHEDPAGG